LLQGDWSIVISSSKYRKDYTFLVSAKDSRTLNFAQKLLYPVGIMTPKLDVPENFQKGFDEIFIPLFLDTNKYRRF
jgi:hypothetical protein